MNDRVEELITVGLDRDAATLAVREAVSADRKGETVVPGPLEQLEVIIPQLSEVAEGADLDAPTPCEGWAVRDVVAHMTEGARLFAASFGAQPAAQRSADDPPAALREALAAFYDAVRVPGALAKEVESPFGTMPGEQFARLAALDGLLHLWDLSTATGRTVNVPDDVVAAIDEFARAAITDELRQPGLFGPPVAPPAGPSQLDALVAFSGRRP